MDMNEIEKMATMLLKIYKENKEGFTVILQDGVILPYEYKKYARYVVSYKTMIEVDEFMNLVNYRGTDFDNGIYGGWYNKDDGIFYIEKNKAFNHIIDAMTFAYQYKQKYIWDSKEKEVIPMQEPTFRDGIEAKVSSVLMDKEDWIKRKIVVWDSIKRRFPSQTAFTKRHLNGKLRVNSSSNSFDTTAGHYDWITGDIVVDWYGLKHYSNVSGIDWLDILTSVISHETMHRVLHKEQGFKTTYMFDCIAGCMEWYKKDLHAGMPLTGEKPVVA